MPDNRGRVSAETALRRWRDELVASEEGRSRQEEATCDTTFSECAELYVMRRELSRAVSSSSSSRASACPPCLSGHLTVMAAGA